MFNVLKPCFIEYMAPLMEQISTKSDEFIHGMAQLVKSGKYKPRILVKLKTANTGAEI